MNRLAFQHIVLAAGLALFVSQSQAHTLPSPYFGGAMTGIYQLAALHKTPSRQSFRGTQDCVDNSCPQIHKAALSQKTRKMLP